MPTFETSDGSVLQYRDAGPPGTMPVVFVHGWQADSSVWTSIAERISERHRTLSLDLRGFGGSNEAAGPYRVETFADDLSAMVAALDLDPLVVVGHSMGAAVAMRFAIDRPDAVEGLVLVAPVPATALAYPPKLDAMFRATIAHDANATAWLRKLLYDEPNSLVMQTLRRAAARSAPAAALESYESWTSLRFADEAATVDTRTLVLAPAHDRPMTPAAVAELVADPLARGRLVILPDAAHYAIVERPDTIANEIERFIADL